MVVGNEDNAEAINTAANAAHGKLKKRLKKSQQNDLMIF